MAEDPHDPFVRRTPAHRPDIFDPDADAGADDPFRPTESTWSEGPEKPSTQDVPED
jgi:hypothetical protein